MTRFLFATLPSNDLGLLAQSLPIARELAERGHEITFCHPAKAPGRLIADAGFRNRIPNRPLYCLLSGDLWGKVAPRLLRSRHPWRDAALVISYVRHLARHGTAEIWNFDHFMYLAGMGNEAFIRDGVGAILDMIYSCRPEILVDFWNPFACIAARICRIPLVSVLQADVHPRSRGFIWWKPMTKGLFPSPLPAINAVLAEFGLSAVQRTGELLLGDRTLVLGLPETDPLPEGTDATYIGPLLWQREDELPKVVAALGTERPVIWVYPGNLRYVRGVRTFGDSEVILQACVEALAGEDVQVVLTTGFNALPRGMKKTPANFLFLPYVPPLKMAGRSRLLIHHGGFGSCQTGLYAGKPALIIPTYSERESNARRIAGLGAGDYVLPVMNPAGTEKRVSAEEVRAKVFRILSDDSYARAARKIGERMRSYGGPSEAARIIEQIA
jgi:UDP:flavonoid glycosyltransferase YjiC (YdhE family)